MSILSAESTIARVSAKGKYSASFDISNTGIAILGNPTVISEIFGTSSPSFIEINVHKISAIICDGTYLFNFLGIPKTIKRVSIPSPKAGMFGV